VLFYFHYSISRPCQSAGYECKCIYLFVCIYTKSFIPHLSSMSRISKCKHKDKEKVKLLPNFFVAKHVFTSESNEVHVIRKVSRYVLCTYYSIYVVLTISERTYLCAILLSVPFWHHIFHYISFLLYPSW
jgi:hypothetical protein